MKIKKVSTEQFAGIREREVTFGDGINVVYGKNESGKSTLVNLISRTLFQDAKTDRRRDREFISRYFPGEVKGSLSKNGYIQGKIVFESEEGEYILTKEWGEDPLCKLSAPFGMMKNQSEINAELRKALVYGEGIYSEMIFPSQHNMDLSLRSILDSAEETDAKREITDFVTKAFSESDGISAEDMEKAINKKIEDIEGKHWERESAAPVRRAARWSVGIGEIHKAYYALEDARKAAAELAELENRVAETEAVFRRAKAEKDLAEENFEKFSGFAAFLSSRGERRKNLERLRADLQRFSADAEKWPGAEKALEKALILEKEQKNREILGKYNEAKPVFEKISELKKKLGGMPCPAEEDIIAAKKAERIIESLKNSLCGINLSAAIKIFGKNSIGIKSLATGEELYNGEESLVIKEAVAVSVPGVMEMQLLPANVDFEKTERELIENKAKLSRILIKYGAADIASLEKLAKDFAETENEIRAGESRLDRVTGFMPFAEIEKEALAVEGEVRPAEEIAESIREICKDGDIRSFITKSRVLTDSFKSEYGSAENLREKISGCKKSISEYEKSEEEAGNIPKEYLELPEPEEHRRKLKATADRAGEICSAAAEEKTAALVNLANFSENHPDPKAAVEEAGRKFTEQKQLLDHWLHIRKVFEKIRGDFRGNPMEKLSESFADYLGIISGEKVSSEFPDEEKLDMNIYSGKNRLDYGKLSEGTKETVSLAFRLAVLDHLFPEGGGVIVFDDPFTDMDAERTEKSCELIKECAKKHQVIFLTCNEEYKNIFEGRIIDI